MSNSYWSGPYKILISDIIDSVVAEDGINIHQKSGNIIIKLTEQGREDYSPMTKNNYLEMYAIYDKSKDCYFWKWNPRD